MDDFLVTLIDTADRDQVSYPLQIIVQGQVIRGHLVPTARWMQGYAGYLAGHSADEADEAKALQVANAPTLGTLVPPSKRAEGLFIYFVADDGAHWRIRATDASGWAFVAAADGDRPSTPGASS